MDVKQLLIDILSEFDFPVILQGSMSDEDTYPSDFFTFFNNETWDYSFYDNQEYQTIWDFDVNFYSIDPERVNRILLEAKRLLKDSDFVIDGAGYDVISDEETHTGRGMNVLYIQKVG